MAASGVGKHLQDQTKNSLYYDIAPGKSIDGSGPPTAVAFPNVEQILKNNMPTTYDHVMSTLKQHAAILEAKGYVANKEATLMTLKAQLDNLFTDKAAAVELFFGISPEIGQVAVDAWNLIVMSRGTAHIKTNNSLGHPIVDPNYFGHPLDLALQTAACKQCRQVYHTEPLASYVAEEKVPGPAVLSASATDAEWEAWVKASFTPVWHYIATLSMMKEEYGGVVDNRLRVYGIENVRAVDASVLPIQLSAHLSSSLYGIAEVSPKSFHYDSDANQILMATVRVTESGGDDQGRSVALRCTGSISFRIFSQARLVGASSNLDRSSLACFSCVITRRSSLVAHRSSLIAYQLFPMLLNTLNVT